MVLDWETRGQVESRVMRASTSSSQLRSARALRHCAKMPSRCSGPEAAFEWDRAELIASRRYGVWAEGKAGRQPRFRPLSRCAVNKLGKISRLRASQGAVVQGNRRGIFATRHRVAAAGSTEPHSKASHSARPFDAELKLNCPHAEVRPRQWDAR